MTELTRLLKYFYVKMDKEEIINILNDKYALLAYPIKLDWDLFLDDLRQNINNMTEITIATTPETIYYISEINMPWGENFTLLIEDDAYTDLSIVLYEHFHRTIYTFHQCGRVSTGIDEIGEDEMNFYRIAMRLITSYTESKSHSVEIQENITVRQFVSTINESSLFSILDDSDEVFFYGVKQNYFNDEKYRKFDNNIVGNICTDVNGIYITI